MQENTNKFFEWDIATYHEALKNGKVTVEECVRYYLDRIDAFDQKGVKLNSIIAINPNAIDIAKSMDEQMKKDGMKGTLFGVPVLLKDNVDMKGMPTTAGSLSLENSYPMGDAFLTQKLKEAGALILAKTNLHEFAIWGETISSVLGQTLNPYDQTRTPGGSSGGTGAAVASNMGMVGIGTDTINSVRSPSSANNLVGIRPTIGMVSRHGVVPYSYTQDTAGPIAKNVSDAVLVLDAIRGYDAQDDETAWGYTQQHDVLANSLKADGLKGKKIGVLNGFFGKDDIHADINEAVRGLLKQAQEAGAILIEVNDEIDSDYLVKNVSVHLYDLKDHLNHYLKTLPESAKVHSLDDILKSGLYHEGVKENMMMASKLSTGTSEYKERLISQQQVRTRVMDMMAKYDIDAFVYPHQKQLTCKVGGSQNERNGVLASVTGFPSICIPAGFSKPSKDAPIGVPIGMEILGRPFTESVLIEIAYGIESIGSKRKAPKL